MIISPMPKPEYPRTTAQTEVTATAKAKIQSIEEEKALYAPFSHPPASFCLQ